MNYVTENYNQFMEGVRTWADQVVASVQAYLANPVEVGAFYTFVVRWILPILAVLIFVRCVLPLLHSGGTSKIWGFLEIKGAYKIPIMHWENSIGRSKLSDIVVNLPFVSRSHAVLSFGQTGWTITDLASKGGVWVNGEKVDHIRNVSIGDTISLATAEFQFLPADEGEENSIRQKSRLDRLADLGLKIRSGKTLVLILAFQLLGGFQILLDNVQESGIGLIFPFFIFAAAESIYYMIMTRFSRKYRELELLIFFLCGLDLCVVAVSAPHQLMKQMIAILLGIAVYFVIQLIIQDVERGRKLKYILVGCSILLMILNLTVGEARFGARNWINLGFITFQPMEFVKVAFVLAGTATLDKLLTTRNLTAFIGFAGSCIGALILMRDLGTSVIFFVTFLVIAFMRSGDIRTIAFISAGAVLGAFAVITFLPYVASRFEAWGHVWQYSDTIGFQQTRTMIYSASGGLLGLGGGNGYLVGIPASDTDLVFGILCEEWGLIVALAAVLAIIFLAFFVMHVIRACKSSFYVISACGAASIFLVQTSLNVFGSLDLLPLTGVTLPFISNGGSSMIVCWALLAFIKAADERTRPDHPGDGMEEDQVMERLGD